MLSACEVSLLFLLFSRHLCQAQPNKTGNGKIHWILQLVIFSMRGCSRRTEQNLPLGRPQCLCCRSQMLRQLNGLWGHERTELKEGAACLAVSCTGCAWASCRAAYVCTEAGGLLDIAWCILLGTCQDFKNISMSKQESSGFKAATEGGRFLNRKLKGRTILTLTHSVSSVWMPAKYFRLLQGDPCNGSLISHLPLASVSKAHCAQIMTVYI